MPRHSALTLLVALALLTQAALRGAAPSFAKATAGEPSPVVAVKAVNARGLEGWDWARTRVP